MQFAGLSCYLGERGRAPRHARRQRRGRGVAAAAVVARGDVNPGLGDRVVLAADDDLVVLAVAAAKSRLQRVRHVAVDGRHVAAVVLDLDVGLEKVAVAAARVRSVEGPDLLPLGERRIFGRTLGREDYRGDRVDGEVGGLRQRDRARQEALPQPGLFLFSQRPIPHTAQQQKPRLFPVIYNVLKVIYNVHIEPF